MDASVSPERPRKRRAINACTTCRASKVRCDGSRPCQRCARNNTDCVYYDGAKDPTLMRVEKLEAEVNALKTGLEEAIDVSRRELLPRTPISSHTNVSPEGGSTLQPNLPVGTITNQAFSGYAVSLPNLAHGLPSTLVMNATGTTCNAVEKGLISWEQASFWYQSFFSGSHYLVPIFSERTDTFESVLSRNAFLFDAIVTIGCRAEEGVSSSLHHRLQSRLREHLTNILITMDTPSVEVVQAITIMAGYSENGFVLIALALRFAIQLGLPNSVDQLIAKPLQRSGDVSVEDQDLYRLARIWHGVCNLELFFSLDGGKLPGINLRTSSRKIRALIQHPEFTSVDLRLLSQLELNIIRNNAYVNIVNHHGASILPENESLLRSTVQDTVIELSLWLEEWTIIISSKSKDQAGSLALLNIHIQYEWALITLHLKALSVSGIENIAIMKDFQRDMVRTAKEAAARHLHHLLEETSSSPPSPESSNTRRDQGRPAYLTTFKWTMDYVWAKCAFSVLLVLKLALLLRDPLPSVMLLLQDAHKVLESLKRIAIGHIAYFQILQTSIEKCESALREYMAQQEGNSTGLDPSRVGEERSAEDDFHGYAPSEFVFEWDFPGLNLKSMPLGWHDLFLDLDSVF
ncbi:hypothetical protein BU24DRAFT_442242 [Aaosphaeria arxii CBS 175.79]|uniref:Zn(2)-C6 fungal-type domain-containing protein n=1 Tax=Aaosphaeria arxii CBS 175.79 TaxID=1450172 RepID=A0A6A5XPH6_9PLEO|nr:uncharacterized protein BU24DRAFT_442242 [Aaosphaeria arxii CBS 175.79]KAF2015165.1 hypothetical protein BU24DRAFT_442242 [Aaosphaeria arxii CBS 175.79]